MKKKSNLINTFVGDCTPGILSDLAFDHLDHLQTYKQTSTQEFTQNLRIKMEKVIKRTCMTRTTCRLSTKYCSSSLINYKRILSKQRKTINSVSRIEEQPLAEKGNQVPLWASPAAARKRWLLPPAACWPRSPLKWNSLALNRKSFRTVSFGSLPRGRSPKMINTSVWRCTPRIWSDLAFDHFDHIQTSKHPQFPIDL